MRDSCATDISSLTAWRPPRQRGLGRDTSAAASRGHRDKPQKHMAHRNSDNVNPTTIGFRRTLSGPSATAPCNHAFFCRYSKRISDVGDYQQGLRTREARRSLRSDHVLYEPAIGKADVSFPSYVRKHHATHCTRRSMSGSKNRYRFPPSAFAR
jgi:hypothetical protein